MNILFNASLAVRPVTGLGTYTKELIRNLLKIDKKNQYTIFSIRSPFPAKNLPFSCPKSENVSYKSLIFPYRYLSMLWNNFDALPIEKLFGKADVLHSLDKISPFTKSAKVIITMHDMSWYAFDPRGTKKEALFKQVMKTLRKASAIITDSEFSKDEIVKYFPFTQRKVCVIHLGVSEAFYPIDKKEIPDGVHKRYPWDDYILYIGMLDEPRKNVKLLVTSYAFLKKRKKIKEKLILCGNISKFGEDFLNLIKKIDLPEDIIVYSRWIPDEDIGYLYNKARLVVFPSLYEGFGLPVLEAMACRKPIIVSDIPPLKEVAAEAAIFIDPRNYEDLASAIERILSDNKLYDKMAEEGLKRSKEFTWTKTAQQTLKLYEECRSK